MQKKKKRADKAREYCNWIVTKIIKVEAEMQIEMYNKQMKE